MYHIFFIVTAVTVFYLFTIMHSGKDDYEALRQHIHKQFLADLAYNLDIIGELTPKEADFRIDDFEDKWKGYVDKSELNTAIGRLIEATCIVGL